MRTAAQAKSKYEPSEITSLLRPNQIREREEEIISIDKALNAPSYIRAQISDIGEMVKWRKRLQTDLDKHTPRAFSEEERDAAVREELDLRARITGAMLTQAEMRRAPAGAVDHNLRFERTFAKDIARWKHLRLRLRETGVDFGSASDTDVANLEVYRPHSRPGELNLGDGIVQPKTAYHMPPGGVVHLSGVMTEADIAKIKEVDPELAASLLTLSDAERTILKNLARNLAAAESLVPDAGKDNGSKGGGKK